MIDLLFIIFLVAISFCICLIKCNKQRDDEAAAHEDLRDFRQTQSQRRERMRRGDNPPPSAPPQDPEEQRKEREKVIKSALFSRTLEHGESVSSMRSMLSAAKEEYNESKKGSFVARSWRATSHSIRTLTREECTICLDKYEKGDTVVWSKKDGCDHIFHEDCISQWLHNHDECPLCRTNLIEGVDADADEEEEREGTTTNERERNTNESERNATSQNERNAPNGSETNVSSEGDRNVNNEREAAATNEGNV